MKKIFIDKRSELTERMRAERKKGYNCYRVRASCICKPTIKNPEKHLTASQKNAVLVIENSKVLYLLVHCRFCKTNSEQ